MNSLIAVRWGRWTLFLLGWAAISLLFAPEAYLTFYLRNVPISWRETLQLTVVNSAIASACSNHCRVAVDSFSKTRSSVAHWRSSSARQLRKESSRLRNPA